MACLAVWAWVILDVALDAFIWNSLFFIINFIQAVILIYKMRPIKFEYPPHERIYQEVFAKVGVSRLDFKAMAKIGLMRSLKAGSYYIEAGNLVNNLSLVYRGKLELMKHQDNRPETVNECGEWDFVEAPEWAARCHRRALHGLKLGNEKKTPTAQREGEAPDDCVLLEYQDAETISISAKALSDCLFLSWPVEQLEMFLNQFPHIAAPFNAVVGADVARKLYRFAAKQTPAQLQLTGDQQFLANLFKEQVPGFEHMDAGELVTTGKNAKIRRAGTIWLRAGEEASHLAVLKEGEMEAVLGEGANEKVMYVVKPPQFLAAVEFASEDHVAALSLRARSPCSLVQWDAQGLRDLRAAHPSIHHTLSSVMAADLSAKMTQTWFSVESKQEAPVEKT